MLTSSPDEGITVAQPDTGTHPRALKPATESMTLLVAAVILHDKTTDRVLLLQRGPNAKFAQGMWDLPVGKSDPGEPVTDTAVRELYEETGITVKPEQLRLAHIIHGAWGVEAPNGFLTVVFTAHEWTGEPENREPQKPRCMRAMWSCPFWVRPADVAGQYSPLGVLAGAPVEWGD